MTTYRITHFESLDLTFNVAFVLYFSTGLFLHFLFSVLFILTWFWGRDFGVGVLDWVFG